MDRTSADRPGQIGSGRNGHSADTSGAARSDGPVRTPGPVLIAYDGFAPSAEAIVTAAATVAERPAAVLHVWEPLQQLLTQHWLIGLVDRRAPDDAETVARDVAEHIADYGARVATHAGLTAHPLAMRAEVTVAETILQVADNLDAAVIVLGAHGHDGLRGTDLGRVAHHVVTHSARPALVVASPAAAHTRQAINDPTGLARAAGPPTAAGVPTIAGGARVDRAHTGPS